MLAEGEDLGFPPIFTALSLSLERSHCTFERMTIQASCLALAAGRTVGVVFFYGLPLEHIAPFLFPRLEKKMNFISFFLTFALEREFFFKSIICPYWHF